MEIIVDAADQIAGRLASVVAKSAIKGDNIHVINSEKAIISGHPDYTIGKFREKVKRGDPYHGPFYPVYPDKILKRMVRGMIAYKKPLGKLALKRVKVYLSVPEEFTGKETKKFRQSENKLHHKKMTLGDLALKLGAHKTW